MNWDLANSEGHGFIKLWYSMKNWEWSDDPNTVCLWVHLLLEANWKDKEWKGHEIKRGQLIFGRKSWADKTGLSEQQLRTALNKLISTNNITSQSTNQFTILTIVNYDNFQCKKENTTNDQPASQPTSNQPVNQRATTPKDCSDFSDGSDGQLKKNNKKKKDELLKSDKKIEIPEYIPDGLLNDFYEHRKSMKKPMTDKAKALLINKLTNFYNDGFDPKDLLEEAIIRGWQTIYQTTNSKKGYQNAENRQHNKNINANTNNTEQRFNQQQDQGYATKLSDYERKVLNVRRNLGLET